MAAEVVEAEPARDVARDVSEDHHEEEREHRAVDELRIAILPRTEERIGDVPAVELADGEEVDHRHEHPAPGAKGDRRQLEIHALGLRRREEVIEHLHQDRLAELHRAFSGRGERHEVRV